MFVDVLGWIALSLVDKTDGEWGTVELEAFITSATASGAGGGGESLDTVAFCGDAASANFSNDNLGINSRWEGDGVLVVVTDSSSASDFPSTTSAPIEYLVAGGGGEVEGDVSLNKVRFARLANGRRGRGVAPGT